MAAIHPPSLLVSSATYTVLYFIFLSVGFWEGPFLVTLPAALRSHFCLFQETKEYFTPRAFGGSRLPPLLCFCRDLHVCILYCVQIVLHCNDISFGEGLTQINYIICPK